MGSRNKSGTSPETESRPPRGETPLSGGRSRRGLGLPGWLLVGLVLLSAQTCASEPPPGFPVFAPAAPFLENQERVRARAEAMRAFRGSARVANVVRFRGETTAAWTPIYLRIRDAEILRDKTRAAGLPGQTPQQVRNVLRAQNKTLAAWWPIYGRGLVAEDLRGSARARGVPASRIRVLGGDVDHATNLRTRRAGQ